MQSNINIHLPEGLAQIYDYADQAHGDQMRKYAPDRYMIHPLRVMQICQTYECDLASVAAALLHDVLEDTEVSTAEMRRFLQEVFDEHIAMQTLDLVIELTDVYVKSSFPALNRRQRKKKELERMKKISPEAQTIKYADITDNCLEIVNHDPDFAPVFLHECRRLLEAMNKGNSDLRQKAFEVVAAGLKSLDKSTDYQKS